MKISYNTENISPFTCTTFFFGMNTNTLKTLFLVTQPGTIAYSHSQYNTAEPAVKELLVKGTRAVIICLSTMRAYSALAQSQEWIRQVG